MAKRLKFRVWDLLEKKYYDLSSSDQHNYLITLDGKFHNLENGICGDGVIVEQYTGVDDKNGKEIYEGDIIINTCDDEYYCSPAVICRENYEYNGWTLAFKYTSDPNIGVVYENGVRREYPVNRDSLRHIYDDVSLYEEWQMRIDGDYYEVVGNVHQNLDIFRK